MSHLVKKNVKRMVEVSTKEITGVVLELTLEEAVALQSLMGATNSTNRFMGYNIHKVWIKLGNLGFSVDGTPKLTKTLDTYEYFKDLEMKDCIYPGKKVE